VDEPMAKILGARSSLSGHTKSESMRDCTCYNFRFRTSDTYPAYSPELAIFMWSLRPGTKISFCYHVSPLRRRCSISSEGKGQETYYGAACIRLKPMPCTISEVAADWHEHDEQCTMRPSIALASKELAVQLADIPPPLISHTRQPRVYAIHTYISNVIS